MSASSRAAGRCRRVRRLSNLYWLPLFSLAYFGAVRLGLAFVVRPEGLAIVWPASGVALAGLLLRGRRDRRATAAAIFAVNFIGNATGGNTLVVSAGFAAANTLEPVLCAWLITVLRGAQVTFEFSADVWALMATAVFANGATALLGASMLHATAGSPLLGAWLVWWIADGLGIILVAPLITLWGTTRIPPEALTPADLSEKFLLTAVLCVVTAFLFHPMRFSEYTYMGRYMVYPILALGALRFSHRANTAFLAVFAFVAVWVNASNAELIRAAGESVKSTMLSLQLFISFSGFVILALGAVRHERMLDEMELSKYRDSLEEMVRLRTEELQAAHRKLDESERLSLLGRFAGGISHEIRNPLGTISSSAYILKRLSAGAGSETLRKHIDTIDIQSAKCAEILEGIASLTRMDKLKTEKVELNDLLSKIAADSASKSVSVELRLPPAPVRINGDAVQLNMAFKNVMRNAVQAMKGQGKITISVEPREIEAGKRALVRFADTGPGIDKENLEKIFDAMHTTKSEGMGFGLSIVKMVAQKHGGTIEAESEPGKGAVFTFGFPAVS